MNEPFSILLDRATSLFFPSRPERVGVAVSGGSDSIGLLCLLHEWSRQGGPDVFAVTVDHNLRDGSAEDAVFVKQACAALGIEHATLHWNGRRATGNVPDAARRARYGLMAQWAEDRGIPQVALGHTMNDQAETFVMRLARSAGVDGLSAMAPTWRQGGVEFCRPLLAVERSELRAYLEASGHRWLEDPTNVDDAYDRARARKAIEVLTEFGLTANALSNVASHMSEVRTTLYWYVFLAARDFVQIDRGDVIFPRKQFRTLQRDISRRLLQAILQWISGSDYAPRGRSVEFMLEAIRGGTGMTLHGCEMTVTSDSLRFTREMQAVSTDCVIPGEIWDNRWILEGPWPEGLKVSMLGEAGLKECGAWRETGLPDVSLRSSPAVWRGEKLVSAPLAGLENGWSARLVRDQEHFFAALLAH